MDPLTRDAYEAGARRYAEHRGVHDPGRAHAFTIATPRGRLLDLGCGPGLWFPHLGRPLVGCDASPAMLTEARRADPPVPLIQADLEALPFATASFAGVWANKCLQHVAADAMPGVLADLHRVLTAGGQLWVELFAGSGTFRIDDDLPGRRFTLWDPEVFTERCADTGFRIDEVDGPAGPGDPPRFRLRATRR